VAALAHEGLLVEPSAALSVACLPRLIATQRIDPAAPVIAILTAGGASWPIPVETAAAPRIAPDPAALESALRAANWG
jgi:threonine synthase